MQARTLFLDWLPQQIVAAPERFAVLSGRVALSIQQPGGPTEKFTVRLGDLESPVTEGFDRTAELKLWFLHDTFARFTAGEPVTPHNRQLLVQGDVALLERLGALLAPPSSSLSVRFAR